MKKTKLSMLSLFLLSLILLASCSSDDGGSIISTPTIIGSKWIVSSGTSYTIDLNIDADVTPEYLDYYAQFNDDNTYELKTLNHNGNYEVYTGTYTIDSSNSSIVLSDNEIITHFNFNLTSTPATLSFIQNTVLIGGSVEIGFYNLIQI